MPHDRKRTILERLTGMVRLDESERSAGHLDEAPAEGDDVHADIEPVPQADSESETYWQAEPEHREEEGELPIDMFETAGEIILKTLVAGVAPDDLDITITREMVTIRGRREQSEHVMDAGYFYEELYWGAFSRSIVLPDEIEVEEAEATERYGMLTLKLPKINKDREAKIRVKST